MAYTTTTKVRLLTNLTTSQVSDADMTNIILEVTKELNSKVNVQVVRERVEYIDSTRENKVNGTNTTFYVKNWKGKYLADMDDDGDIDTSDIKVYAVASDGTETTLTVSSVDYDDGKFVLDSAPTSDKTLYVTYEWSYFDEVTPDAQLSLAATLLTAAYCYAKVSIGSARSVRMGNVSILKEVSEGFDFYYKRYMDILKSMNGGKLSDYRDGPVF